MMTTTPVLSCINASESYMVFRVSLTRIRSMISIYFLILDTRVKSTLYPADLEGGIVSMAIESHEADLISV